MDAESKPDLHIIAPDRAAHGGEICDLCAKVFHNLGYYRMRDNLRNGRILKSHYDWKASRIGIIDGRIVTHWGVYDCTMRIGSAVVRVAAVGLVATDGDFRGRGLMDRTARAAIGGKLMAGYDLTFLTGIDNYYSKFGYVRSWPYDTYYVKTSELPAQPVHCRSYAFKPRPDLWKLYNREHDRVAGTAVHPTFSYCKTPSSYEGFEWKKGAATAGYAIVEPRGEALAVLESAGDVQAVLSFAGAEARKRGCKTVEFPFLARLTRLAAALRQGNCRVETSYRRDGAAMMRTINLRSTLEKMTGELTRRMAQSPLAKWSGKLLLEDARERVVLWIEPRQILASGDSTAANAIRSDEHIVQLLIGTSHPDETVRDAGIKLRGDARMLLPVLFPCQYPQMGVSDQI